MSDCCESKESKEEIVGEITCPECSHKQPMTIPTTACQAFYKCESCEKVISAQKSCCVFCDYGDRKCPVAEQHTKTLNSQN